jgi:hypothetical protein
VTKRTPLDTLLIGAAFGTSARYDVTVTPPAPQRQQISVKLVSGESVQVQTPTEARWFNDTREAYRDQLRFTEITDLRDLDRVLVMELMIFRWTQWLASGKDNDGWDIDNVDTIRRNIGDYSAQITKVKDSMGLSKKVRDDAANDGNFSLWLQDLLSRARVFGFHRENQLQKALVLVQELSSIVGSFDRSDAEERGKLGFDSEHEILEWVRHTMLPEFRAIDEHFRDHEQRMWSLQ